MSQQLVTEASFVRIMEEQGNWLPYLSTKKLRSAFPLPTGGCFPPIVGIVFHFLFNKNQNVSTGSLFFLPFKSNVFWPPGHLARWGGVLSSLWMELSLVYSWVPLSTSQSGVRLFHNLECLSWPYTSVFLICKMSSHYYPLYRSLSWELNKGEQLNLWWPWIR